MPTTPNLGLDLPVPGVTAGPEWAEKVVDAFEDVDGHNHAPGSGARVPSAGININAPLEFNGQKATEVAGIVFQQIAVADNGAVYVDPNGDLYFRDAAGNLIRLTISGGLNLAAANITADLSLNGFRLTGVGSQLLANNGGAILTALALYIQSNVLKWNDHDGTALTLASDNAVDPPVVTVATSNTALSFSGNPQVVLVDTSAGAITITLPPPATAKKPITIADKAGQASTNNITIARNASESICGVAASLVRRGNFGGITLFSDGTNWHAL